MKVIENNFEKSVFPTRRTCNICDSIILLESENDCEYQPASDSSEDLFSKVECYFWDCPCCGTTNYIYL